MKFVLALALLGSASATLYSAKPESQKYLFENFKAEHSKAYATMEEEAHRFEVFVQNLKTIDQRNAKETGTAVHGITKFTDMTEKEFKTSYLNYKPSGADKNKTLARGLKPLLAGESASQDWTGVYTTPVKDQGYCGSCWAFSATEQIESDYMRTAGDEVILSAQQITSCTPYVFGGGCNGGFTENAFDYANKGVETDANYPYTSGKAGVTGTCQADSSKFVVKTTGYTNVASGAKDESTMAAYVKATGPLSICVDASSWSSYTGGILSTCGTSVDHCVQAVGIDTTQGYWKVRNSWGTSWGESGFIRLAYGDNTCEIASDANYATTSSM
jgi:C1A family cysteine protease